MRLLKQLLAIAALLSLAACIVQGPFHSYTAADGSSQATYTDGCWTGYPLSSTVILDRPDVLARLDIHGVRDDLLWAGIVVTPRPGTVARMLDSKIEVMSHDFKEPMSSTAEHLYEFRGRTMYFYRIPLPTIPSELSLTFPKLELQGQMVEFPNLVLRSEGGKLEFVNLACQ